MLGAPCRGVLQGYCSVFTGILHNASALQSLMYTAGTKGKREVDKEICRQHCAVASLFLRGVAAKRARKEKESR